MAERRQGVSPIAGLIAFAFLAMMIWLAVTAVKGVFLILSWLAIPLFVIALVFNYRVFPDHLNWIWRTMKVDPLKGGLYALGSVVCYPFVLAFLAFKAYASSKFGGKKAGKIKGEYVKYEEVEDDFLELPDIESVEEKEELKASKNEYDDLF